MTGPQAPKREIPGLDSPSAPPESLIDTHCHLGDRSFEEDRPLVLERAREAGVIHVIIVAESADEVDQVKALARRFEQFCTAGVHPHRASSWNDDSEARIRDALADPGVVAVGETGLDYHYEYSSRNEQKRAFEAQLALADECGKAVVVHCREADEDMTAILRALAPAEPRMVLHSFSAGPSVFEAGLEIGAYFSFSGMITFKSWKGEDLLKLCPLDRILLETDAPYLAPVPFRGRRNEPAWVREVAKKAAQVLGLTFREIAARSTANALQCFGIRTANPNGETR